MSVSLLVGEAVTNKHHDDAEKEAADGMRGGKYRLGI